ncbi:hypothetical protein PC118_g15232 [Phytophthora cactorum]|uniref:Uncharacterized protein n=1 Tax=Phytophthora cactorum TaxID=29920 RepID=A0A8T1FJW3_9STRA|nr:hypothetical protein PC118_g15232 [Phytophthora cactorum]
MPARIQAELHFASSRGPRIHLEENTAKDDRKAGLHQLYQSRLRSQPTPTVQLSLSLDLCLAVVRGKGWRHRSDPSQGLAR